MIQVDQAREQIAQSNTKSEESTVTPVIDKEVLEEIYTDISALNYQTQIENPLCEIKPHWTSISNVSEISEALNSFSVTGKGINRHDIAANELARILDKSRIPEVDNHPRNTNDAENEQNSDGSISDICKKTTNVLRDKPVLSEIEQLKQEMNSFLLKILQTISFW